MMRMPKVSIIIPVYNGSDYMKCAIDCALSQTYENKEIIVINDGSTDDGKTEEIAMSYGNSIRYFSKPNGGVSSALNYGIAKMTGEYFSWLSHDDAYSKHKIKDSIELLASHHLLGERCIAFTGGNIMDASGKKIRNFRNIFENGRIYFGHETVSIMTEKGTLYGCRMLIPKQAFEEAGNFDESLRYSQDSLMWYRIFLAGFMLISDDKNNVMCRMHKNQVTQRRRDLYVHDSLVIAKLLAEPLAKADAEGKLLFKYIKRQMKHQCKETINYLCNYALKNGYLGLKESLVLNGYRFLGFFRCKIAAFYRKVLIALRH